MIYAVIDTNVFISALITKNSEAATVQVLNRNDDAYLVTGNQKHYPIKDFIVTPSEMMEIINTSHAI